MAGNVTVTRDLARKIENAAQIVELEVDDEVLVFRRTDRGKPDLRRASQTALAEGADLTAALAAKASIAGLAAGSVPVAAEGVSFPADVATGMVPLTATEILDELVTVKRFGAIGDGTSHPLSETYGTLAAAQAVYPEAIALSDEKDWCAITAAFAYSSRVSFGTLSLRVNRTIAPGRKFSLHCDAATVTFAAAGTYTDIDDGSAADTGFDIAWDMFDCSFSTITGSLSLQTDAGAAVMTKAARETISATLVGYGSRCGSVAATNGDGNQTTVAKLTLTNFAYGLYAPDSGGTAHQPYTATAFTALTIQRCRLGPFWIGSGTNALDDVSVGTLRLQRNTGIGRLRSSSFTPGNVFMSGLRPDGATDDAEAWTISTTAASTAAVASTAMDAILTVGDLIAIEDAGSNKNGDPIWHVTRVAAVSGTSVTLTEAAGEDTTGALVLFNPPTGMQLQFGAITASAFYAEHIFGYPILCLEKGCFTIAALQTGGTSIGGRFGSLITHVGSEGRVRIDGCDGTTAATDLLRRIVAVGLIKSSANGRSKRSISVDVGGIPGGYDPIGMIDVPADLVQFGTETDTATLDHLQYFASGGTTIIQGRTAEPLILQTDPERGLITSGETYTLRGSTEVTASSAATLIADGTLAANSLYSIWLMNVAGTAVGMCVVRVSGGGTESISGSPVAVGGSFSVSSGDLRWTDSLAADQTVRWKAVKELGNV